MLFKIFSYLLLFHYSYCMSVCVCVCVCVCPVLAQQCLCLGGACMCRPTQRGNPGVRVFLLPLRRGRVGERGKMTWRGVQRQGPDTGDLHSLPQGDTATAYLFLHFYFFFILFHRPAFHFPFFLVGQTNYCNTITDQSILSPLLTSYYSA